jgi:hypothetical protein
MRVKSGFLRCGCGNNSKQNAGAISSKSNIKPQPSKTDKETNEKAQEFSNGEVPTYNKLFISTLIGIGFLIFNQAKEHE